MCLLGLVVLINVVALRRARLVLGWVTILRYTILVFNQMHPGLLSLAIPPWVLGRHNESPLGKKRRVLRNSGNLRRINYTETVFDRFPPRTPLVMTLSQTPEWHISSPFSSPFISGPKSASFSFWICYPHFLDQSYAPCCSWSDRAESRRSRTCIWRAAHHVIRAARLRWERRL